VARGRVEHLFPDPAELVLGRPVPVWAQVAA
jgi:hypothetical protein